MPLEHLEANEDSFSIQWRIVFSEGGKDCQPCERGFLLPEGMYGVDLNVVYEVRRPLLSLEYGGLTTTQAPSSIMFCSTLVVSRKGTSSNPYCI